VWKRLRNEELHDLHCSPNIIGVVKSIRVRWAGHIAQMGRREVHTGFRCGNLRERDYLEDLSIDGRIILKLIFKKWDVGGMERIDLAQNRIVDGLL